MLCAVNRAALARAAIAVTRVVVLVVVLGAAVGLAGLVHVGVGRYVHPVRTVPAQTPDMLGLAYQNVTLHTSDGLDLAAWYLPGSRSEALILLHGIGSNRADALPLASRIHTRGYSLLLPDLRAHGQSGGDTCTLGVKEVEDIRAALEFLQSQPGIDPGRVGIWGVSLGAATALQAAAQLPDLHAVAADSAFSSARWLVQHQLGSLVALPDWFGPALLAVGGWEAGVSPDAIAPVDAMPRIAPRPVLLIQGDQDALFAPENARLLLDAARGPADLWEIPHAGHGGVYALDPDAYVTRLDRFFTQALATESGLAGRASVAEL